MPHLEVCLSPELFPLLPQKWGRIVVIDVLRASTTICAALESGAQSIVPVANVEDAKAHEETDCIKAAERNGQTYPGFEYGNSPLFYQNFDWQGRSLVLTTTNGTRCLEMAKPATNELVIGTFANLSALANRMKHQPCDTLLFCAGWKGRFNLEDTLFAGAVVHELKSTYETSSDAALAAQKLYESVGADLMQAMQASSHYTRLANKGLKADIEFCLKKDSCQVIPILKENRLVGA